MRKKNTSRGAAFSFTLSSSFEFYGYFQQYMTSPKRFLINTSRGTLGYVEVIDEGIRIAVRGQLQNIILKYQPNGEVELHYSKYRQLPTIHKLNAEMGNFIIHDFFAIPERFPEWFTQKLAVIALMQVMELS